MIIYSETRVQDLGGHTFPPTMFYLGGKDKTVCNTTSQKFYDCLQTEHKSIYIEPEDDHSPFRDGLKLDRTAAKIVEWFEKEF